MKEWKIEMIQTWLTRSLPIAKWRRWRATGLLLLLIWLSRCQWIAIVLITLVVSSTVLIHNTTRNCGTIWWQSWRASISWNWNTIIDHTEIAISSTSWWWWRILAVWIWARLEWKITQQTAGIIAIGWIGRTTLRIEIILAAIWEASWIEGLISTIW